MNPAIPPHIQIEMARRELAILTGQKESAEYGIALLNESIALATDVTSPPTATDVLCLALAKIRLAELQSAMVNLTARTAELQKALQAADSGILRPGGVLPR